MKSPENNFPGPPIGPAPEKQSTPNHNIEGAINAKWDKTEKIKQLVEKKEKIESIQKLWTVKQADLLKQITAFKFSIANRETDTMSADLSTEARDTAATIIALDKAFLAEYEKKFTEANANLQTYGTEIENLAKEIHPVQRSLHQTEKTLNSQIPESEEAINNYHSVDYDPNED